nr:PREDICTED: C-type lectin domain family 17, member A-like [Latimeria chalumnae]|eukprot:XP_014353359.1 PREDICTED: C-type lectin domain family 17, member A-like [Latimeria chalumnae]
MAENTTYHFAWSHKPWSAAKQVCQTNFTNLVSIDNEDDNRKFSALFYPVFWIGLSYSSNKSKWEWANGNPVRFMKWAANEPLTATSNSCAYMKEGSCPLYEVNPIPKPAWILRHDKKRVCDI